MTLLGVYEMGGRTLRLISALKSKEPESLENTSKSSKSSTAPKSLSGPAGKYTSSGKN